MVHMCLRLLEWSTSTAGLLAQAPGHSWGVFGAQRLWGARTVKLCAVLRGGEIEQKRQVMPYSRLAGFCGQQFPLEEVLELPASKPGADNILRTTAFASLQDSKTVAGKLMVKGEVTLKIFVHFRP